MRSRLICDHRAQSIKQFLCFFQDLGQQFLVPLSETGMFRHIPFRTRLSLALLSLSMCVLYMHFSLCPLFGLASTPNTWYEVIAFIEIFAT